MGEIGISRHEFYSELRWWEVQAIIKGYRKRGLLRNQLIAECAYAATFAMRDPKGKTSADLFPSLFAPDDEGQQSPPISDEEVRDIQNLIATLNSGSAEG